jgi:hypothetical protein
MSWKDRLRGSITLTSPSGIEFTAKWVGNDHSKEKKVGVFEYPNNNGTRTQDLGVNGTRYPLTLYFDGPDNDIESLNFYKTCDERGPWEIIHPTDGKLTLQLTSISRNVRPVESGNVTVCETQWIEPSAETSTSSTAQTAAEATAAALDTNITTAGQYSANITQNTFAEVSANEVAITNVSTAAGNALETISSINDEISAQFLAIQRGIQDSLDQAILEPLVVAGQIQQLTQLPALAVQDIEARLNAYIAMADEIFNFLPDENGPEDKNSVNAYELGLSAVLTAASQTVITGPLDNRVKAIEFANKLTQLLSDITENLDNVQENFSNNDIDTQYFSNSQGYNDLAIMISKALRYLLDSLLSLSVEKRFTLDRPRAPLEITVTEYGSLGDNDENLDFFIQTNNLSGSRIRLLPAGVEVVVYV